MTTTAISARPCGPYPHLIPAVDLKTAIERQLEAGPSMLWDLAPLLGYSESTVRLRLLELQQEGRVHRIESRHPVTKNRGWLWCAGPEPEPDVVESGTGDMPVQVTTTSYPVVDHRDPLVAALFGPSRQVLP